MEKQRLLAMASIMQNLATLLILNCSSLIIIQSLEMILFFDAF